MGKTTMTRDEFTGLSALARGGCVASRNAIAEANLGLVWRVARRYLGRRISFGDLVGEGNLGLLRAAELFDPAKGATFGTFATQWIEGAIQTAVRNTRSTIRLPAHTYRMVTRWRWAVRRLSRKNGVSPTFDEVATELGLCERKRKLVFLGLQSRRYLEGHRHGAGMGSWRPSMILDYRSDTAKMVDEDDEREWAMRRLESLDRRERSLLSLRYGLDGSEPMTIAEVGRAMGVPRQTCALWIERAMGEARSKVGVGLASVA